MLFDPGRHEPILGCAFDERAVRTEIQSFVDEAEASFRGAALWLPHPDDHEGKPSPQYTSLFVGAAGTLWSLAALRRLDMAHVRLDLRAACEHLMAAQSEESDAPGKPGLLVGELGVRIVAWRLTGDAAQLAEAHKAAVAAIWQPELELMWAAPGAAVVARAVFDEIGDEGWRTVLSLATQQIVTTLKRDEDSGHWLWTQCLDGNLSKHLGAVHGFAGNAQGILAGLDTLAVHRQDEMLESIAGTLIKTARVEGVHANWWPKVTTDVVVSKVLTQYCHGAPGVVIALARYPRGRSPDLDRLLAMAGQLTWDAGPLRKPHGLCHGTAGNAYAFLALAERTGDPVWRERARAFAMHAIAQSQQERARHGRRRMSLWLGDAGLVLFLADLLRAAGERFPTLERF